MEYYFNKTLNFQKLYQEDLSKPMNNPPIQKTLPKSKSSNELVVKKQEKENPSNNIFLNTWGFNKSGQLANSTSVLKTSQLNIIKHLNDKPVYVSAGENHTAILTNKLKLYVSGANSFGQLGIEEIVSTLKPTILPSLSHLEIVSVACGADFTYAMSSKGEVFSWGSNFKGQLGLGDYENRSTPCLVSSLAPFGMVNSKMNNKNPQSSHKRNKSSNVSAYQKFREKSHSVDFNHLNDPFLKSGDETKVLLDEDERVLSISCGALHTLVKTDKNKLFSCGFGETYALGNGETKNLTEFEPVIFMKTNTSRPNYQKAEEIEKIACGLTHSGCIRSGKIYIWGLYSNRESSALKIPTLVETAMSGNGRRVENDYFIDIVLGDTLSVVLNSRGEVFTFGENIDGQLGIANIASTDYPMKVGHLPAVNQISCGRNHVFAMNTETKQVYAWGSNLFGQLSLKNKGQSIYSPKEISALSEMDVLRVSCGSFHTLALSCMPSPIEPEENDLLSDDDSKTVPSLTSTTVDLQKYQDEVDKLRNEIEKLKAKNHFLALENEKLKSSEGHQKGHKRGSDAGIQVNLEERKGADDAKHRNRRDKSPEPKPQRVLHPQVEIDFKEITLEKQISEGGYGLIYKGRWRETIVAVKMLKIDMKEEHIRDFIYECYTMESLRHPNIVMFLGACTKPPNLAIVLEFCSRGSLWSALQNPDLKLSWEDRRRMAADTARGVNYLHSFPTPVLHRDLKSLNLLLDENFRIKVADFGWTRTMASSMTGKIGTYQWMAPEVISGHNYTEKADVFSFGIVLWEIASREPPYRNINGLQVSIEVVQNDLRPTIPKKTPEAFTRLMKKCWDRDPNKRPSFVEIIKELETMKLDY